MEHQGHEEKLPDVETGAPTTAGNAAVSPDQEAPPEASDVPSGTAVTMAGMRIPKKTHVATNYASSSNGSSSYWESDLADDDSESWYEEDDVYSLPDQQNPPTLERRVSEVTPQQIMDQRLKLSSQQIASASPSSDNESKKQSPAAPASETTTESSSKTVITQRPSPVGAFSVRPMDGKASEEFSNKDDHGSSLLQLEAVPVDELAESKRLEEMEERLNREIEERLAVEQHMSSGRVTKTNQKKGGFSKETIPIVMSVFLILCGIGVGLYFWLGAPSGDDETPVMPSGSPTEPSFRYTYDPPSAEDCQAVLNGLPVENQDELNLMKLEAILDVTTYDEMEALGPLTQEILNKTDQFIIPTMVGCFEEGMDGGELTDSPNRYIVANGRTVEVLDSGDNCVPGSSGACYRLLIHVDMWVKEEDIRIFDLIALVDAIYGPKLIFRMDSGDVIEKTFMVNFLERFN